MSVSLAWRFCSCHLPCTADVASFDAALFRVSAGEAAAMDAQQRLMLECAWEAVAAAPAGAPTSGGTGGKARGAPSQQAGGSLSTPKPRDLGLPLAAAPRHQAVRAGRAAPFATDTGVYVGASYAEWSALLQQHSQARSPFTATGSVLSVIAGVPAGAALRPALRRLLLGTDGFSARPPLMLSSGMRTHPPALAAGRISYLLGLSGPAVVTNTACSSSLVALSSARNALRLGVVRSAIR